MDMIQTYTHNELVKGEYELLNKTVFVSTGCTYNFSNIKLIHEALRFPAARHGDHVSLFLGMSFSVRRVQALKTQIMKRFHNQITICCNYDNKDFFYSVLSNYKLKFKKLDYIKLNISLTENIVFFYGGNGGNGRETGKREAGKGPKGPATDLWGE